MNPASRFAVVLAISLPLCAEPPSFTKHVAPILFEHCAPCHRPGEAAPFPLLTYDDARRHAAQIADVTRRRYMPPWPPGPGYGEFAGSRRLSDEQIAVLTSWAAAAAPQGNPADLPPAPKFIEGWQLGAPDLVLHMSRPYPLPADGSDVFRNFILPLPIGETRYVRAMELRPTDKRVVHHANLIVDRSRMLRRRDGQDGQPGFAGMDVETEVSGEFDPDSHFLFWKPGSPPTVEAPEMVWKLDPGSDLVLNLHLRPSGKPESVEVSVGLYFGTRPPTRFPMLLQLEHDGAIDIPAGAAAFTVADHLKIPVDTQLLAIYPHAHYLGKRIEAWVDLPGGERRPLLRIDDWDINWQATYTYKEPIRLPAGTTVRMRITYDNTAANPRNPSHPPQRVKSGNRSEDEMGHVWLQVLPERRGDEDPRLALQQALMERRIEKYPADFVAHFNLGAALQSMGKHEQALEYLARAVRIRPDNATARNNLAVSLLVADRVDEAIRELRESLRIDPEYGNARYNLARALDAQGDSVSAARELETYLSASVGDAQAHGFLARLYMKSGRAPDALPHFRRAVELAPADSTLATNLGAALATAGDLKGAITAFERALESDPGNQTARENLARARAEAKKP
jgi:Flp pilus assembly protein TadD